jgi:carboxyl-terminal processing protease
MSPGALIVAAWFVATAAAAADLRTEVAADLVSAYYHPERVHAGALKAIPGASLADQLRAIDPWIRLDPPADEKAARVRSVTRHAGLEISETRDGSILVQPLPGGPAERAGLANGWLLRSVGAQRVHRLDDVREAFAAILPNDPLWLEVMAPELGQVLSYTIAPPGGRGWDSPLGDERPAAGVTQRGRIWHARILRFQGGRTRSALEDGLRQADAAGEPIVLDLRGNSGGAVLEAFVTAALLLPAGTPMGGLRPAVQDLGDVRARSASPLLRSRIDVVIDRYTASAAEVFAAILRDTGRARLVGERSSGKCVVEEQLPLSGGARLTLPVAEFVPPGGQRCHGDGAGLLPEMPLGGDLLVDTNRLLERLGGPAVARPRAIPLPSPRLCAGATPRRKTGCGAP